MTTKDELIAKGYKPFTQHNLKEFTNSFWQKCVRDDRGKKYYITIAEYDNSKFPEIVKIAGAFSYQPEVQFTSHGITFNVDMLQPESILEMEHFFENMWNSLECDYYEYSGNNYE